MLPYGENLNWKNVVALLDAYQRAVEALKRMTEAAPQQTRTTAGEELWLANREARAVLDEARKLGVPARQEFSR